MDLFLDFLGGFFILCLLINDNLISKRYFMDVCKEIINLFLFVKWIFIIIFFYYKMI